MTQVTVLFLSEIQRIGWEIFINEVSVKIVITLFSRKNTYYLRMPPLKDFTIDQDKLYSERNLHHIGFSKFTKLYASQIIISEEAKKILKLQLDWKIGEWLNINDHFARSQKISCSTDWWSKIFTWVLKIFVSKTDCAIVKKRVISHVQWLSYSSCRVQKFCLKVREMHKIQGKSGDQKMKKSWKLWTGIIRTKKKIEKRQRRM